MSTARRTGTNENINTYGSSGAGRDYTSLQTWESATDNDLVTSTTSEVLECYDDDASYDNSVGVSGATVNSTYFRIIRAAETARHNGTPSTGVYINNTNDAHTFYITEEYFQIQDIICEQTINSTNTRHTIYANGVSNVFIGCLIVDSLNAGSGRSGGLRLGRDGIVLVLCLVHNVEYMGIYHSPGAGNTVYYYNCTLISNPYAIYNDNGTCVVKNTLANGNTFESGDYTGSSYNASSDTSAPGTNSRTEQTFTFVDSDNDNFHLSGSDAGAKDYGDDLSADGVFAFDDDIDFETISTWSIGFDSIVAAAGALPMAQDSYFRRRSA